VGCTEADPMNEYLELNAIDKQTYQIEKQDFLKDH